MSKNTVRQTKQTRTSDEQLKSEIGAYQTSLNFCSDGEMAKNGFFQLDVGSAQIT